ncbi:hypothetical protein M422DRAFT_48733 [Sphaerobolus stellatus SS14]|uniref:Uncharacterized protein n=1 Tax=Sphaerobolus stellatus (strain SS14) TaxID=990650 RepID=A0A0C9UDY6_SPHS4|nr:hypothetical protein M422DRAFT_48733 [Sphaerobolus stellatus SS14]
MTDTEYLPVNVQTPLWSCSCGSTPLSFLFRPHNPTSILILLELVQRSHVIEVYVLLMWYTNSAPIKCEVSRDSSLYRCFPVRILFYSAPLGSSSSTQQLKLVLVNSVYFDDPILQITIGIWTSADGLNGRFVRDFRNECWIDFN